MVTYRSRDENSYVTWLISCLLLLLFLRSFNDASNCCSWSLFSYWKSFNPVFTEPYWNFWICEDHPYFSMGRFMKDRMLESWTTILISHKKLVFKQQKRINFKADDDFVLPLERLQVKEELSENLQVVSPLDTLMAICEPLPEWKIMFRPLRTQTTARKGIFPKFFLSTFKLSEFRMCSTSRHERHPLFPQAHISISSPSFVYRL